MKLINKVTILGCGNGGMALAADLKSKGAKVALWSDPQHANRFNEIMEKNNEIILHDENIKQVIKLDFVSSHLDKVLDFGGVIYNCTPMSAHTALFKKITFSLNQAKAIKILINLSGAFSGIEQLLKIKDKNILNKIKIFDTSTFPYACRAGANNEVTIFGRKSEMAIAPLFPMDIFYLDYLAEYTKPTKLNIIENAFKLGLMGTNAVFHPATVLLNARLIDNGCSFLFYKDGISKNTSQLHDALDNERIQLASAMGYKLSKNVDDINKFYGTNFSNNYDYCFNSTVHEKITSPQTLNHRYITEDVACGLVPLLTLGKLHDIKLLNIESVVNIFSTIMGVDYYQCGRNLNELTKNFIHKLSYSTCMEKISA